MFLNFTVWGLAIGSALLISGNILLVAVTALIGIDLAPNKSMSTLPVALQFLGMLSVTLPAALLVKKWGRKPVFLIANLIGVSGALLSYWSLSIENFWCFSMGTLLLGVAIGVSQQYRFAAVENCAPKHSAQAISIIMIGGILSAILGPNLAIWSEFIISERQYLGGFAVLTVLYALTTLLIACLPLASVHSSEQVQSSKSYLELLKQPKLLSAITAGAIGYGVMVLVMTATPLAMANCGFMFDTSANVIQWHVLGMFVPSFFTGKLIAKYGAFNIVLIGCALLIGCVLFNQLGIQYWHFLSALVLLGIGWNFTFIGATTLLTQSYEPADKAKVQGMNDLLVFSGAAVGSLMAGYLHNLFGWTTLNLLMLPVIIAAMFTLVICRKLDTPATVEA